jgi:hypothetical protein
MGRVSSVNFVCKNDNCWIQFVVCGTDWIRKKEGRTCIMCNNLESSSDEDKLGAGLLKSLRKRTKWLRFMIRLVRLELKSIKRWIKRMEFVLIGQSSLEITGETGHHSE